MKITTNTLERFLGFLKLYQDGLIEDWSNLPNKDDYKIKIKILRTPYIKERMKILDEETEEGTEEWWGIRFWFCNPYRIHIWNSDKDSDRDGIIVEWEESIFDISIEKLVELMKKNNKKYLSIYNGFSGYMGTQNILRMELEDYELV